MVLSLMGYYSHFKLDASGQPDDIKAFENYLKTKDKYDKEYYECFRAYFEEERESTKWYEYQEDLKRLSTEFPTLLFILYREGGDAGDLEYSYYKNGKMQLCPAKYTFDEYNPSLLVIKLK